MSFFMSVRRPVCWHV